MKIVKIEDSPNLGNTYHVTQSGNNLEIKQFGKKPECNILNIDKDHYAIFDKVTGEVQIKEKEKAENRAESTRSLKITFQKLRDLINTNVTDNSKCLWITLTYTQENGIMDDLKTLYYDFNKFIKRLNYYLAKKEIEHPEYINVVEPQGSGAWHMHLVLIFKDKRPFIPNDDVAKLWQTGNNKSFFKRGFTKTQKLSGKDNLANYLCSYLTDLKLNEHTIAKNARMYLYPSGVQIFRHSKGIKKPKKYTISGYRNFVNLIKDYKLEYKSDIKVVDDNNEPVQFIKKMSYKKKV